MYRIYCYCSEQNNEPKLKMYWNKRLNDFTFNKPTLMKYPEAFWFVINKYLCNEYKEEIEDVNYKKYFNYYCYGIEDVK